MSHRAWPPCLWGTRRPVAVWRLWGGGQFPHLCLPRIPDAIGWHADCACGGGGRGLVDAGTRQSGGYRVRLEWVRMPVSVVCAGRIGRIGRRDGRAALAAVSAAATIGFVMRFERQATIVRAIWQAPGFGSQEGSRQSLTDRAYHNLSPRSCLLRGCPPPCWQQVWCYWPWSDAHSTRANLFPGLSCDDARSLASAARGFAVALSLPDRSQAPHRYRYRLSRGPGVPR
jgi:hypothetical protein